MNTIKLLSDETINKIAAGEVVEKPLNVVKELVENSIDAMASAITVEIKGGGVELIRVTDNGKGIDASECANAFLRHATSKITNIEDLESLSSLGFRGEALSSVSAVSKLEMITKTKDSLLGMRVVVEGGKLCEKAEVGAPDGTTMIVRSLFYNTPARKKFLKTPASEGSLIEDLMEKFALSHPEISFQFILNGKTKISTSGNGSLKDVIFYVFGKDVHASLLDVKYDELGVKINGFCAKPEFSYQARNGEIYFINGRFVKSKIIKTAIEEVYRNYLMQHRFPFCVLSIDVDPKTVDVNVHPQKLEVKFSDNALIMDSVLNALRKAFEGKELIPDVSLDKNEPVKKAEAILPKLTFEETKVSTVETKTSIVETKPSSEEQKSTLPEIKSVEETPVNQKTEENVNVDMKVQRAPEVFEVNLRKEITYEKPVEYTQETLFDNKLLSSEAKDEYHIIGQIFNTYWIIELNDEMFIVDQHAAHEKVNYEHFVSVFNDGTLTASSQMLFPPLVVNLSTIEKNIIEENFDVFTKLGFEIEDFGIGAIVIRSIPENLFGIDSEEMFHRLLDELMEKEGAFTPTFICEKLASLSCKAAIKGGQKITVSEMENLMKQLMKLDNPYNCPHGRPVFIKISKTEMEKRFKRIV